MTFTWLNINTERIGMHYIQIIHVLPLCILLCPKQHETQSVSVLYKLTVSQRFS